MSKNSLIKHYEQKYSQETSSKKMDLIGLTNSPTSRFEAVVKFFPKYFKSGDILEIGCGNGNVAKSLLSANLDISSYSLGDISLPRIEGVCNNLQDERVRISKIDAENISESEYSKYDAIIMIALIEHLIDPLRAMQQIRKLLKPNGFVYIDTPNFAKYTRRLKLFFGKFPSTASENEGLTTYSGEPVDLHDEGHLHYFTYSSLSSMLLERCSFSRVEKIGYHCGFMPLGKHIHNFLATIWPELFSELAIIAYV